MPPMSSSPKNDAPAAKVVMKVPTPDSLVEVKVSPPDSNFEVKVAPGEEIIELHIRAGSGSFVEVRICPPPEAQALDGLKPAAPISVLGGLSISQAGGAAIYPSFTSETEEDLAPLALADEAEDAAEDFIEKISEEYEKYGGGDPFSETAEALNALGNAPDTYLPQTPVPEAPDTLLGQEPDLSALSRELLNVFSNRSAPVPQADISGIPGPDPALFEDGANDGKAEAGQSGAIDHDETSTPDFITEIDEEELINTDWSPPESAAPLASAGEAAMVALARLSAAVEKEKAEMAANPGVWASPPREFSSDSTEEDEQIEPPTQKAGEITIIPQALEAAYNSSRKTQADSTIMVRMYDDQDNSPSDGAFPLSKDEEMEIGPLDDELSLEPIDVDGLEDIDLEKSQMPRPRGDDSNPKAKPLSTVLPGNTIIPK